MEFVEIPGRSLGENKPSWAAIGVLLVFPSEAFVEIQVQVGDEEEK